MKSSSIFSLRFLRNVLIVIFGNFIYAVGVVFFILPSGLITGGRAAFSDIPGPEFAPENRIHWLCGHPSANRAGARAAFSEFRKPAPASKKIMANPSKNIFSALDASPTPII